MCVKSFADVKLLKLIPAKVKTEREATAAVLELLAEIDSRKLYLKEGYNSMYSYLTIGLSYSEGAAQRRIECARALRSNDKVKDKLRSGDVSLTTLSMVSREMLKKDKPELLEEISGKSKKEVEQILFKDKPAGSKTKESITTIKVKTEEETPAPLFSTPLFDSTNQGFENRHRQDGKVEARLKLSFSVPEEARSLIEEAKQVLSGRLPRGASLEELFVAGLESILNEHKKKTKALGTRKSREPKKRTRHIPNDIRKAVLERDKYQCTYVGENGKACCSNWNIEVDHIVNFAEGGEHTVENLRVLCRPHNQLLAEQKFGRVWEKSV